VSHHSVAVYVGVWATALGITDKKVLDIGSFDVNGNNKTHFTGEYTGLDFREGPNVDLVSDSWSVPAADSSFDVIVSTEMLEHDEHPERTFAEIRRLMKPEGHVILTCRGPGYPKHEWPNDFHRFTPKDLGLWLEHLGFVALDTRGDVQAPGAMAVGFLPKDAPLLVGEPPAIKGLC